MHTGTNTRRALSVVALVAGLVGCSFCSDPQSTCGDTCVDLSTDTSNCGACGNVCGTGYLCTAGACTLNCANGLSACGATCLDLMSNTTHCGGCSTMCGANGICAEGRCVTPPTIACMPSDPMATPQTYDYVLNTYTIEDNADPSQAHTGFNVDFVDSPSGPSIGPPDCDHQDAVSTIDPDQSGGVDNQLPAIAEVLGAAGLDLGLSLNAVASHGVQMILVRVSDVSGALGPTLSDCDVGVQIFFGHPLAINCSTLFNGAAAFAVDDASLAIPGDLTSARFSYTGQIVAGRLYLTPVAPGLDDAFPMILNPTAVTHPTFLLHDLQIRASLTPSGGNNGNLGGYVLAADLVPTLTAMLPGYSALLQGVVGGLKDVAVGSPLDCGNTTLLNGDTDPNGGVSVGMGFTMVPAVVAPTTVSAPPPGACGSP